MKKLRNGKIQLEGAVLIGRHCQIEDGVTIIDSCIDNYSKIGKNVVIENSAVMDRAIIEEGTIIRNSIIGRHVTIKSSPKNPTVIENISVIADDVVIEAGTKLEAIKVYPHLFVKSGTYYNTILS